MAKVVADGLGNLAGVVQPQAAQAVQAVAAGGGVWQRIARVGQPLSGQQCVEIQRFSSHGGGHLFNRVH